MITSVSRVAYDALICVKLAADINIFFRMK